MKFLEHQYYSSEFGEYKKIDNNIKKYKVPSKNLKGFISNIISNAFLKVFDHMKDNQILVAKKKVEYSEVLKKYPSIVHDVDTWVKLRKKHNHN